MAELYLVRHGQASFGAQDYDQLSTLGEQQCVWLGEYFAQQGIDFDRVICGGQRRHIQSVDAISKGLGKPMAVRSQIAGLNEYDFKALLSAASRAQPEIAALAAGSMKENFLALRQALTLWSAGRLPGPLPETWAQFQQRVADARAAIQKMSEPRLLVVSSGGPISTFLQQILGGPAACAIALNLQILNCSVSRCFFNSDVFHLASFNATPQLDAPERQSCRTYG